MLTAFVRAFQTPDLRKKMLVTLALIALFRLGASLPTPGIADTSAPSAHSARGFIDTLAAESRVSATAVQTVGAKGYDGFALALVTQTT